MKKIYLISFVVLMLLICIGDVTGEDDRPEKLAQKEAESWMPLWDSGKYDESYDELAEDTRNNIPKKQWFVYWSGVRKPLGKLKTRKLIEAKYIKSLPGLPDHAGGSASV